MMRAPDISLDEVRDRLAYDPKTGVFTWRRPRGGSAVIGGIAGSIDTRGYRQISINKRLILAHRLAWFYVHGEWPGRELDHRNGDRLDNRIENLRLSTRSQNCANAAAPSTNTSGFKGVSLQKGRWKAQICVNRKKMHIGMYATKEKAHAAYVAVATAHFGEFARVG